MGSTVISQLHQLLRSTRSASEPALRGVLSELNREIRGRLERGSNDVHFFLEAARALSQVRGAANHELRLDSWFRIASFLFFNGRGAEGLSVLRHMNCLALQTDSQSWSRKAITLTASIEADMGNVAGAVSSYWTALELARHLHDQQSEAIVWINLAVALNYGALYREAVACSLQAIALLPPQDRPLREKALANLAQSRYFLGQLDEARAVITECLASSSKPTDSASAVARAIREYTFVQIALAMGDLREALLHAASCNEADRIASSVQSKACADIASALCELHTSPAEGIRKLHAVLHTCGETAIRADALAALIRAYDEAGQPEESLACLESLLSHLRSTREKGIAALIAADAQFSRDSAGHSEDQDLRELRYQEAQLRARVAERKAMNTQLEMLERFAITADLKNDLSGEHGYRVGKLSGLLASRLGMSPDSVYALELAAQLHDIGKLGIPDAILLSPAHLKDVERHLMRAHTEIGAGLLCKSTAPHIRLAEEIARYHHEWWNGDGYPAGLARERIPIHARIVALADVFDALTHGRPYAAACSVEDALALIVRRSDSQFDPALVNIFVELIVELAKTYPDLDSFLARRSASPFSHVGQKIRSIVSTRSEQALSAH